MIVSGRFVVVVLEKMLMKLFYALLFVRIGLLLDNRFSSALQRFNPYLPEYTII